MILVPLHKHITGGDDCFTVTASGKEAALKDVTYPKLTRSQKRYRRFLNADSGMPFGEWLRTGYARMA